jgi:uncharacterized protein (TIGR00369 family)
MFKGSRFVGEGFALRFAADGNNILRAEITFDEAYMGPPGIVHGGALAAVLDEAMTATVFHNREPAFTAQLNVRYRQPVRIGERVRISGWLTQREGRKRWLRGEILNADDQVCVEAEGLFILMTTAPHDRGM